MTNTPWTESCSRSLFCLPLFCFHHSADTAGTWLLIPGWDGRSHYKPALSQAWPETDSFTDLTGRDHWSAETGRQKKMHVRPDVCTVCRHRTASSADTRLCEHPHLASAVPIYQSITTERLKRILWWWVTLPEWILLTAEACTVLPLTLGRSETSTRPKAWQENYSISFSDGFGSSGIILFPLITQ